ncbi:hypothetical protein E3N88_31263 [Mikania micrantha]|uniref:Uncharacterized protein n=1 Tax=Mikania micrantha TaxID=192012 RepID=A0A5N6MPU2_9ASTR|nr:hypothetical protein E3N88_31263 [Mikania micrantha]
MVKSQSSLGDSLKKLEERGIVIRFVLGRSPNRGDSLDRNIDEETRTTKDFLILDGHEESPKNAKFFFSTGVQNWDAEFYAKRKAILGRELQPHEMWKQSHCRKGSKPMDKDLSSVSSHVSDVDSEENIEEENLVWVDERANETWAKYDGYLVEKYEDERSNHSKFDEVLWGHELAVAKIKEKYIPELMCAMQDLGEKARWPPKDKKFATKDKSKWCAFHEDFGHITEDCIALRKEISYLLSKGHLKELLGKKKEMRQDPDGFPKRAASPPKDAKQEAKECYSSSTKATTKPQST